MLYLLGINLPDRKLVHIALQGIYGLGRFQALKVCHKLEIHPLARLDTLPPTTITSLSLMLNNMELDTAIKNKTKSRVRELIAMGSYRGLRLAQGKPARGQRTRTNRKTAKKLNPSRAK